METVVVRGVPLAVERAGEGPPLVMVHGSWTDHHGWDLVAPKLAERFHVIRYDRRGHSESGPATGSVEDDVLDLAALLEALDAVPAHAVGSSFGGVVALRLAAARPDVLRSVVAHEPPLTALVPDQQEADQEPEVIRLVAAGDPQGAARLFVEEMAFGPGAWETLPRFVRETFVRNASTFPEERADPDVGSVDLDRLNAFPGPILLTEGTTSPAWFGTVIRHVRHAVPGAAHHVYEDAGHNPQATHARGYVRVVGDFLRRADA